MSAAKCLVSLMVLLVAAVAVVGAQERIKMCGRELIRLAVSSCGNSRLRRSIPDIDLSRHPDVTFRWDQHASMEEQQALETAQIPPQSDGEKGVASLAPHWFPVSSRIRRASGKISDICCERGCSMKELIQFC
ncbi:insulin-like 3 (Leydig cell) [Acanthochromis polyacanthus]|uniref:insulin-like 3 (Leydig cell) n=1 Tax=Acanthochromis polyacanthus TaxID=80966 RepID=UPI002234E429|nr:insulin-like 3 (Leydig cell) [Acanthochromis polyacanthus]